MNAQQFAVILSAILSLGLSSCGKDAAEQRDTTPVAVSARILYENGAPVAGTDVRVEGPSVLVFHTDSDGRFSTTENDGLIPGKYRFAVGNGGALSQEGHATVSADTTNLTVKLVGPPMK